MQSFYTLPTSSDDPPAILIDLSCVLPGFIMATSVPQKQRSKIDSLQIKDTQILWLAKLTLAIKPW